VGERPLAGLWVLELATEIAGPYAGKLLRDLGADVLKAEPPGGDPSRARGPFRDGCPDPDASGFFLYLNGGKRTVTLDLETPEGRAALLDLAAGVDVMLESFRPGELERRGLGVKAFQERNPRLVIVSVTPFGLWGPRSGWDGNDLIAFHASGFAYGFPSREVESPDLPPLNAPSHAGGFLAGEMAAGAAVHGLLVAQRTGRGSRLDVSLREAVAAENQSQHDVFERDGVFRRDFAASPSNPTVALLPCRDGWIAISPREEHQWLRWLEVMGNPAWGPDPRFADRAGRLEHWPELYPLLAAWSRQQPKRAVFEAAQSRRVACYPLGTATDLLQSPQLASRGFFAEQAHPRLGRLAMPGVPYHLESEDGTHPNPLPAGEGADPRGLSHERRGPSLRASPCQRPTPTPGRPRPAGEGADLQGLSQSPTASPGPPAEGKGGWAEDDPARPLTGVRVVDFSWVMAGPICTKYLAALGAEVIKVESRARPDLSHRDLSWEELNPGKRSITLNLKEERARDLVRRLIALSDVVVENFSTGVMERLGLGYPALRELSPRIIMASASGFGRTGPERDRVAYGTLLQCYTGWAALSAHPGRPPRSAAGIWTDPLTAGLETLLLLAAILRQRATGRGCYYDISMSETTIAALPEPILAWSLNRELLGPRGNRDPIVAPQGCYPAAGDDRWLALTVRSDAEWATLCALIGRPDLGSDPELATAAGRHARHDEIDAALAAWTRERDARTTAEALQAAGIAATPTLSAADVVADEHLAARAFVSTVERLAGGARRTLGVPWLIDGTRPAGFRRAPRVGEDNRYVFAELLGLDGAEYDRLVREQVIH
jgi:crotonobetainyl-CoA:carnitine CoA-transferase CaiB-like acyl-CoA transferase